MLEQRQDFDEIDTNYPHIQKVIEAHWDD